MVGLVLDSKNGTFALGDRPVISYQDYHMVAPWHSVTGPVFPIRIDTWYMYISRIELRQALFFVPGFLHAAAHSRR